jgi:hypothetical protein
VATLFSQGESIVLQIEQAFIDHLLDAGQPFRVKDYIYDADNNVYTLLVKGKGEKERFAYVPYEMIHTCHDIGYPSLKVKSVMT